MLQQELELSLSPRNKATLQEASEIYDCGHNKFRCGAEVPLLGDNFMDLSVRLRMDYLTRQDFLDNKLPESLRKRLIQYAQTLKGNNYDLTRWHVWLEIDTSAGVVDRSGLFVHIVDKTLFSLAMNFLDNQRQEYVKSFLTMHPLFLRNILYLGLMYSRMDMPLKVISQLIPYDFDLKIRDMEQIVGKALPADLKDVIKRLYRANYIGCNAAIEIMPDGVLGNIAGLEIVFTEATVERLREIIMEPAVGELWEALLRYGVLDERYKRLSKVTLLKKTIINGEKTVFLSYLSHIKLSWDKDGLLPVKAYIGADFNHRRTEI